MNLKLTFLAAALVFSLSLQAGEKAVATEKPSFSATQTVQLTASVVGIDRVANTVTLKGPEGNSRTLEAQPYNLKQIDIGDTVNVEYAQNMTIEVFANDGMEPGAGIIAASGENVEGAAPAAMEVITTIATATVEEINIEALRHYRENARFQNWMPYLKTEIFEKLYAEPLWPKNQPPMQHADADRVFGENVKKLIARGAFTKSKIR